MRAYVNDTELFATTYGQGWPMLLMHGGLGPDHTYFRPWLDPLGSVTQLIYYDHRGGGRSSRLASFEGISHDTLASDADALRELLGHEKVLLFGHSYGGMLALEYALRYQDHLHGLILCCTALAWNYPDQTLANAKARGTKEQIEAVKRLRNGPIEEDVLFRKLWNEIQPLYFSIPDPKVVASLHGNTIYSASAFDLSEILLADFDLSNCAHQIDVPTLVIGGRHDWVTPPEKAEALQEEIPNSDLIIFEGSGHYPFVEEHVQFVEKVARWITDLKEH